MMRMKMEKAKVAGLGIVRKTTFRFSIGPSSKDAVIVADDRAFFC